MFEPIDAREMAEGYRAALARMRMPRPYSILRDEAAKRGITVDTLKGKARDRKIAWARQEIMHRMRAETDLSLPAIGRLFGRDHTTVLHALRAVEKRQGAGT